MHTKRFYTLSASCPDQVGIIARVAGFIADHQGWILESRYHSDGGHNGDEDSRYFMRIEVKADSLPFHLAEFRERFRPIAEALEMDWKISDSAVKKRVVIFVSKQEHCLYDLLARWQSKELDIEIPCVISNHDTFKGFVEWHGIPFHHVPVNPDNQEAAYAEVHRLYAEAKGETTSHGLDVDTLYGQLLRRMAPGADHLTRYGVVVRPSCRQHALRVPEHIRSKLRIDVYLVSDAGAVEVVRPVPALHPEP